MGKRDSRILELLSDVGHMDVAKLAERVGVSQVTLRKDLDALEARSLVRREHGVAMLNSPNDVSGRLALHYDAKVRIARAAATMVADGETVMVEGGSCCALLARELLGAARDVRLVTNSAFIAAYVRDIPGARVVLLGGDYQPDSQAIVGPMVADAAAAFRVRTLFVGADGWDARDGFTNSDHLRARAVHDMAPRADRVIVLTDSGKFERTSLAPLGLDMEHTTVVTDEGIAETALSALEDAGAQVVVA